MKRTLVTVVATLAMLSGRHVFASVYDPPHNDYRLFGNPGYKPQYTCDGTACHSFTNSRFLPGKLDGSYSNDFTNFCLACHNATGEAHDKQAGTPSNNAYISFTGLLPGDTGSSHSWNGDIGNAGTRVPTIAGFAGTFYMPGGKVRCQTCHYGMDKTAEQNIEWAAATDAGDRKNFVISWGSSSTKQYLAQYLKVYRYPTDVPRPSEGRTKKDYLVNYTAYTYNNQSRTITFTQTQGAPVYVYADIPQPYLRVGNAANQICADCHNDRLDRSVSHAPGARIKDSHPVMVPFADRSGLHATLKDAADNNAFIEGGTVECTSCHDPHNSADNSGMVLRNADKSALCSSCHKTILDGYSGAGSVNVHNGSRHSGNNEPPTLCLDCHTAHGSSNILLIKDTINGKPINFQNFTGGQSFGPDTGYGICEVCHTRTSHHLSDNAPAGNGHNAGYDCSHCHPHSKGFSLSGDCDVCHGFPPGNVRGGPTGFGWSDTTGQKHQAHMNYLNTARFGYLTGVSACDCCHAGKPGRDHPDGISTAFINTTSHIYWQGLYGAAAFDPATTAGMRNTADDLCTNVICHSRAGSRVWNNSPTACDSCHEYPGSLTQPWPAGNAHNIRFGGATTGHLPAGGYNAAADSYASMTADPSRCGKCHPDNSANHMNGAVNVSAAGNAACGGGGFTFNVVTSQSNVTCSNVKCHSGMKTPNWYGGTVSCGGCHGSPSKTGEPRETPEDKDNCSNTGRGLHGVHMNYSSASYGRSGGHRGSCDFCHVTPGSSYPTATHDNGFVTITGHLSSGRQSYDSTGLSYNFTGGTCLNACHRNRNESARWGNYTAVDTKLSCRACHDDVVDKAGLSGAHAAHLSSATIVNGGSLMGAADDAGCVNCHPDNTDNRWSQGKADDGTKKAYPHATDGTNVVPDNAVVNEGVGAAKAGLDTTCAGSCHRNTLAARWGDTSLNCDACHYYRAVPTPSSNYSAVVWLKGSHSPHFNAAKDCTICHPYPAITCGNCHPVPPDALHAHSLPPVSDNAVVFSNLSWTTATHTCSNTGGSCHGVGVLTPDWTQYGR